MYQLTKFVTVTFILFGSLLSVGALYAQSQEKIYSVMMLQFARGMEWPDASNGQFTIGVLGYPPLAAALRQSTENFSVRSKPVVVREYLDAEGIDECQMIFVPAYKSKAFGSVLIKTDSAPTLIVCNKNGMAAKGAGINLILVEGKLKYEINSASIEKRGIKISAGIKKLGIAVN